MSSSDVGCSFGFIIGVILIIFIGMTLSGNIGCKEFKEDWNKGIHITDKGRWEQLNSEGNYDSPYDKNDFVCSVCGKTINKPSGFKFE